MITLRDPKDEIIKKFDTEAEALKWLEKEFLPKHAEKVAHIHVDRV